MKAILIDARTGRISDVNYDGSLDQMYKLLDVKLVTTVRMRNGDILFVDDEGLINGTPVFFRVPDYPEWLAGNGLIVGDDGFGESCDCKSESLLVAMETRFGRIPTV